LLLALRRRGWTIKVVTDVALRDSVTEDWKSGLDFHYTREEDLAAVLCAIDDDLKAEAIFSQSRWFPLVERFASLRRIPSAWFPRRIGLEWDPRSTDVIVANSQATAGYVRDTWSRESLILHPLISPEHCVEEEPQEKARYITMVNPVAEKGGELFRSIAERMPDHLFLAVRGWKVGKIQYADLDLDNVTVCGPFDRMGSVYAATRLFLMPSQWEEAFGRVAVEAMMNGIPVISSDRGALPEVVGDAGTVLTTRDPEVWVREILSYADPGKYRNAAKNALRRARDFDVETQVDEFLQQLDGVLPQRQW
jgi:glycosyltransferase involved in cell wall biosynthesis